MLQNHCKGIDFSPNNQKKTHKMFHCCCIFLIYVRLILTTFSRDALLLYIIFLPKVALFVVKHAKKWYLRRIKVKKMLLKRGILQKI